MHLVASQPIRAPLRRVFDVFVDVEHAAGRVKGVKRVQILSETRSGAGVRWRETRELFGKEADADKEIVAVDPPRSFRVESLVDGTNYVSVFDFAEGGAVTTATWTHTSEARTWGAKLMAPMFYVFGGTLLRFMKQDLADLAEFLEAPVTPP